MGRKKHKSMGDTVYYSMAKYCLYLLWYGTNYIARFPMTIICESFTPLLMPNYVHETPVNRPGLERFEISLMCVHRLKEDLFCPLMPHSPCNMHRFLLTCFSLVKSIIHNRSPWFNYLYAYGVLRCHWKSRIISFLSSFFLQSRIPANQTDECKPHRNEGLFARLHTK